MICFASWRVSINSSVTMTRILFSPLRKFICVFKLLITEGIPRGTVKTDHVVHYFSALLILISIRVWISRSGNFQGLHGLSSFLWSFRSQINYTLHVINVLLQPPSSRQDATFKSCANAFRLSTSGSPLSDSHFAMADPTVSFSPQVVPASARTVFLLL